MGGSRSGVWEHGGHSNVTECCVGAQKGMEGTACARDRLAADCPYNPELTEVNIHAHDGLPDAQSIVGQLAHDDALQAEVSVGGSFGILKCIVSPQMNHES